jgi:hypothetical protein
MRMFRRLDVGLFVGLALLKTRNVQGNGIGQELSVTNSSQLDAGGRSVGGRLLEQSNRPDGAQSHEDVFTEYTRCYTVVTAI